MTINPRVGRSCRRESAGILFDVGYCVMDETPRLDHALGWLARALEPRASSPRACATSTGPTSRRAVGPDPGEPSLLVQMLRSLGVPAERPRRFAGPCRGMRSRWWPTAEAVPSCAISATPASGSGILANQPRSDARGSDRAGIHRAVRCASGCRRPSGLPSPIPPSFDWRSRPGRLPAGRVAYVGDRPDNDVAARAGARPDSPCALRRGPHAEQVPRTDGGARRHRGPGPQSTLLAGSWRGAPAWATLIDACSGRASGPAAATPRGAVSAR